MEQQSTAAEKAILVIDLQTGMFDGRESAPIHMADTLTQRVRDVLQWARDHRHPVCFIRHDGEPGESIAPGAAGWPVWPALGQATDEPTFSKDVGDAFSQPALVEWAAQRGLREVILLGAQTEHCVTATVKGALARGFQVTVVADAHSTWDWDGETAAQIIARQNATFQSQGARLTSTAELTGG
jgi:nicotinamidase-related amidase